MHLSTFRFFLLFSTYRTKSNVIKYSYPIVPYKAQKFKLKYNSLLTIYSTAIKFNANRVFDILIWKVFVLLLSYKMKWLSNSRPSNAFNGPQSTTKCQSDHHSHLRHKNPRLQVFLAFVTIHHYSSRIHDRLAHKRWKRHDCWAWCGTS